MDVAQIIRFANSSISNLIVLALRDNEVQRQIIELNTIAQLFNLGEDSEGVKLSSIGGEYSPVTLRIHPEKKADRVTLYDTGEFYDSFSIKPESDGDFQINSDPIKNGVNLFDRWGDKVEGLNNDNYVKALKIIEQKVIEIICR